MLVSSDFSLKPLNSISVISRRQLTLFMLSWVSPVLGWALKCLAQGHSHEKNPEDPVRLEPRTPGLRVKHSTTEPRGTRLEARHTTGKFCTYIGMQGPTEYTCPLTHYQTTNFRLFQIERLCRRQFKIWRKWQKVIQTGRKHCGKKINCSLRAISPFPSVFKRLVSQGRQKVSLCGNGLIWTDLFIRCINTKRNEPKTRGFLCAEK